MAKSSLIVDASRADATIAAVLMKNLGMTADEAVAEVLRMKRPQHDFEADLRSALGDAMKADDTLASEVYAALCNVDWEHDDGSRYGASWRYAGGLVAEIRTGEDGDEDYMTWYCNGNEGRVSDRVSDTLAALGWKWTAL